MIRFGEDFEFDLHVSRLSRSGRVLKLARIPAEFLAVLVEQRGQVVSREQIVERIWGVGAFLDTNNSINGAIRKIRQVLKDDPEQARFIQTVTGEGYRFIAPVTDADLPVLLGIAIVLIAPLGFYLHRSRSKVRPTPPSGRLMLAVFPFENLTGDPSPDYFRDGMTEETLPNWEISIPSTWE